MENEEELIIMQQDNDPNILTLKLKYTKFSSLLLTKSDENQKFVDTRL